jgi:hypothetical protein
VFTLPSRDPNDPLKCNILWIISERHVLDIDQFYTILSEIRDMPHHLVKVEANDRMPDEPEFKDNNKHKYTQIKRALVQLQREGWPIAKEIDRNGVAWYSAGPGFMEFVYRQLLKEINDIARKGKMREIKRLNDVLEIEHRMGIKYWD